MYIYICQIHDILIYIRYFLMYNIPKYLTDTFAKKQDHNLSKYSTWWFNSRVKLRSLHPCHSTESYTEVYIRVNVCVCLLCTHTDIHMLIYTHIHVLFATLCLHKSLGIKVTRRDG